MLSGTTVTWAHHALLHNDRKGLVNGLVLTVCLGVLFSMVQAYEYIHAPFGFKDSIYGATFFMATGFHGFHVMIGTIFLLVCLIRAMKGDFTPKQHFGFEAAAWYWHFVDVVWLFLFANIYVWASIGATDTPRATEAKTSSRKAAAATRPPFSFRAFRADRRRVAKAASSSSVDPVARIMIDKTGKRHDRPY